MGIIDEAFPADGGAGFLEVDPHDDEEIFLVAAHRCLQAFAVFDGGGGIVDGAGPNDDEEAVIVTIEDGFCPLAGAFNDLCCLFGHGQIV